MGLCADCTKKEVRLVHLLGPALVAKNGRHLTGVRKSWFVHLFALTKSPIVSKEL
jgi:hypothetical protein